MNRAMIDPVPSSPSPSAPPVGGGVAADRTILWPHSVQLMLALLCGLLLANLLYQAFGKTTPTPVAEIDLQSAQLDLNEAGVDDLVLLPGVGPKLAQRLVDHRSERGPFRSVDELRGVPGIGPGMFKKLRPLVYVGVVPSGEPRASVVAARSVAKSKKEAALSPRSIDVNRAPAEELQKLPGIGPKMAQRIIEHRSAKGPFAAVQDLRKVSGIGPKTLEKIRPYVALGRDEGALASK